MKKIIIIVILLFLLSSSCSLSANNESIPDQENLFSTNLAYVQAELIVGLKDGINVVDLTNFDGYKIIDRIDEFNIVLIEVEKGEENNVICTLQGQSEISFADYNMANGPEAIFSNSCWMILKNIVKIFEAQQPGYENIEPHFFMVASIVGDTQKVRRVEVLGTNIGVVGLAEDIKVNPLFGEAFHIGVDYEGADYFRAPIFIGSVKNNYIMALLQ